jgi:hypothetical protein
MAVIVHVPNPRDLLTAIAFDITSGAIETWSVDTDGDFTHSPEQWRNKAWFRPQVSSDRILFSILTPKNTRMNKVVYGVYHGRFIEMLLTHYDLKFQRAEATALPIVGDVVRA